MKVKCIKAGAFTDSEGTQLNQVLELKEGRIYTVTQLYGDHYYVEGLSSGYYKERFEIVEEKEPVLQDTYLIYN